MGSHSVGPVQVVWANGLSEGSTPDKRLLRTGSYPVASSDNFTPCRRSTRAAESRDVGRINASSLRTDAMVKKTRARLSLTMSVEAFENGYWYATEVRSFAKSIEIPRVSALRKDELEDLIKHFLRTGRVKVTARRPQAPPGTADSDRPITRRRRVVHYKNDRATKDFLDDERARLAPGQRQKPGARYRLNRWREERMAAGQATTYGELAKKYAELSDHEGPFPQARSGRYINFLSSYLRNEADATREEATGAWHELKNLDTPKTYVGWKTHRRRQSQKKKKR